MPASPDPGAGHRAGRRAPVPARRGRRPAVGDQPWAKPIDDLGQPGQPAPLLDVADGRRPEGRQIAQHQGVDRRIRLHGPAEPGLDGAVRGPAAATPQAARRDLHQRHPGAGRLGQRGRIALRPPAGQGAAQVAERQRFVHKRLASGGNQVGAGQPDEMPSEGAHRAALDDRLDQRPQPETIGGGHQVDGRAHQCHAHDATVGEQPGGRLGGVVSQPAPQPDVPGLRRLGLQTDQPFQGLRHAQAGAAQQQLPVEGGAVERPRVEQCHGWSSRLAFCPQR